MPDESLTAALRATENVSEKLAAIAAAARQAASEFDDVADSAAAATAAADAAEGAFEAVADALVDSSLSAEVFAEATDETADHAEQAAASVGVFNTALRSLPDRKTVILDTEFDRGGVEAALQRLTADRTISVDIAESVHRQLESVGEVDVDGTAAARASLDRVTTALDRLDGQRARIHVDTTGVTAARSAIRSLRGSLGEESLSVSADANTTVDRAALTTVRQALSSLPDAVTTRIETTADTDALGRVRAALERLDGETATVAVETTGITQARHALRRLRADVSDDSATLSARTQVDTDTDALAAVREALTSLPESVTTYVDTEADTGPLTRVRAALERLDGETATVGVQTTGVARAHQSIRNLRASVADESATFSARVETATDRDPFAAVRDALSSLPESVTAHVETTADDSALARVRTALERLDGETATVGVQTTGVARAHQSIRNLRASVADDTATLSARTQTDTDRGPLMAVRQALASLPDSVTTHVETTADMDALERAHASLQSLPDEQTVHVRTAVDDIRAPDTSVLRDLTGTTATVDVETSGVADARLLADGLGDSLEQVAVSSRVADAALTAFDGAVPELSASATAAEALDEAALDVAASGHLAAEGISSVSDDAVGSAAAMQLAAGRADELGDELSETAAEAVATAGALGTLGAASTGTRLSIGGLSGGLANMAAVAGGLVAVLGSLTSALGGVAAAGGGAGAALGGIFYGGLLQQGEQLIGVQTEVAEGTQSVADSAGTAAGEIERIETAAEGAEAIMTRFGNRAKEALAPLRTPEFGAFSMGVLNTALEQIGDFATFANRLSDDLFGVVDAWGAVADVELPNAWAELEKTTRALLPMLEEFGVYVLQNLPDALAWLRSQALTVIPVITDFGTTLVTTAIEVSELGNALLKTLIPAFDIIATVGNGALKVFNALPGPVKAGAVAFGLAIPAILGASAALAVLEAVAAPITVPLLALAGAIGVVVAAGAFLESEFGALSAAGGALVDVWNGLVEVVEFSVNSLWGLYETIGPLMALIPGIGPVIYSLFWLFDHWAEITDAVSLALATLDSWIKQVGQTADKWLGPIDEMVGKLTKLESTGKFDFSGAKIDGEQPGEGDTVAPASGAPASQYTPGGSGGSSSGAPSQTGQTPPTTAAQPYRENNTSVTVNMYGSGGDATTTEVERAVERALARRDKRSGAGN